MIRVECVLYPLIPYLRNKMLVEFPFTFLNFLHDSSCCASSSVSFHFYLCHRIRFTSLFSDAFLTHLLLRKVLQLFSDPERQAKLNRESEGMSSSCLHAPVFFFSFLHHLRLRRLPLLVMFLLEFLSSKISLGSQ